MRAAASILNDYRAGLFTEHETLARIIQLAETQDPSEFMPTVPAELSDEIRALPHIINPPESPDAIRVASGMMCAPDGTVSKEFARARVEAFAAFQALHKYFYGPKKLPPAS